MTASTYLGNAVLNAFLRGVVPTIPAGIWVSLHKADPGSTGASEVTGGVGQEWPAYVRKDSLAGDTIANAWSASTVKISLNTKQLLWPAFDGASPITVTHFAIWDAVTGGNCLFSGKLVIDPTDVTSTAAPKTLSSTDELVLYASQLGVKVT